MQGKTESRQAKTAGETHLSPLLPHGRRPAGGRASPLARARGQDAPSALSNLRVGTSCGTRIDSRAKRG